MTTPLFGLRALREQVGVTQAAIATTMGMSQSAVSKIENNPNPRLSRVRRYVEALGGTLTVRAVFSDMSYDLSISNVLDV